MKALPRDTAKAIYLSQYWTEPKFDRIAELSPAIAQELCDTGVNMGPRVASTFLQRWLSALNMQGNLYPDLKPDGAIGNITSAEKLSGRSRQRWRNHAAEGAELQPGRSLS
jgi:lysozyme family protein